MQLEIYKKENFTESIWSGGKTTELYIHPPHSSYAKRNFDLRISTAQVEDEQSTFSALPSINRLLMILKGSIKIKHKGHHEKVLKELEVDQFLGDWETTSVGRCTDFNVMTKGKIKTELFPIIINKNSTSSLLAKSDFTSLFLYTVKGSATLHTEKEIYKCTPNELIVISNFNTGKINIQTETEATFAVARSSI